MLTIKEYKALKAVPKEKSAEVCIGIVNKMIAQLEERLANCDCMAYGNKCNECKEFENS